MANEERHYVVTVAPNSMAPKDEISERNNTLALWEAKALDPITLFQRLDDPDPMQTAKKVVMWTTNPQQYAMTYFPEVQAQQQGQPGQGQLAPPEEQSLTADLGGEINNPKSNNMLGQQAPLPRQ